jgi:hypothetical protein
MYKTTQTPDDVYFSPAKGVDEYVQVEKPQRKYRSSSYEEDMPTDRWLRMRVRNPNRWNSFDAYDWNPYSYGYNGYNSYNKYGDWNNYRWNNYYFWNSFYNPYFTSAVVVNPVVDPRLFANVKTFNPGSYTNRYDNGNNITRVKGFYQTGRYNNSNAGGSYYSSGDNNSNSSLGTSIRKVFENSNTDGYTNGNTYTPSSNDRPVRTYTPSNSSSGTTSSSSSGSSSSSSSTSSGPVSRPGRG